MGNVAEWVSVWMCMLLSKNGSNETKTKAKAEQKKTEKQQKTQTHTSPHSNTCRACPFRMHFYSARFGRSHTLSLCVSMSVLRNRRIRDLCFVYFWFFFPLKKNVEWMLNPSIYSKFRFSFFIDFFSLLLFVVTAFAVGCFSTIPRITHINLFWLCVCVCGVTIWNRK